MKVIVNHQNIEIENTDIVSNSVGIYECEFEFNDFPYTPTAVFQLGYEQPYEVLIVDNKCIIPHEVLSNEGFLKIGVYGVSGELVCPTIWSDVIRVYSGTTTGATGTEPTPSIYEQILTELQNRADGMSYEGNLLKLLSGETILAQVTISGGGSGGISSVEIRVQNKILQLRVDGGSWTDVYDLSQIVDGYATQSWVEGKGYQVASDVASAISSAITDMATKSWVNQQGFLTQHQSLSGYYTKQQTDSAISNHHDSQKLDASHISHETWTFTLDDDTEVNKEVCLWT